MRKEAKKKYIFRYIIVVLARVSTPFCAPLTYKSPQKIKNKSKIWVGKRVFSPHFLSPFFYRSRPLIKYAYVKKRDVIPVLRQESSHFSACVTTVVFLSYMEGDLNAWNRLLLYHCHSQMPCCLFYYYMIFKWWFPFWWSLFILLCDAVLVY